MTNFAKFFRKEMNKKSRTHRILKALLVTLSIPVILFWVLIILLYIPPVQKFAVDYICKEASKQTGYDISISSVHLAFPLKLRVSGFEMSKESCVYALGDKANLNISLMPLFKGEVELNYISLEHIKLDTREMIPDVEIKGEIGYFRTVARNIDLTKEIANIRQVHLHSANIHVTVRDSISDEEEEEDEEPLKWKVNLRRAKVENCTFTVSMPLDTMQITAKVGKLRARGGHADLENELYSIAGIELVNSDVKYDKGIESATEAPLDHLELQEIYLSAGDLKYKGSNADVRIDNLMFIQPGGIRLTGASAIAKVTPIGIELEKLSLKSKNGSYLNLAANIPWMAFTSVKFVALDASLDAGLNKKDLAALLTQEQYNALSLFEDKMFDASMKARGNVSHLEIDTMAIDIPSLASLNASGSASEILDIEKLQAALQFNGKVSDIRRFISHPVATDNKGEAAISGKAAYSTGKIDALLNIDAAGGNIALDGWFDMNHLEYDADIATNKIDAAAVMPDIPLSNLTLNLKAKGNGFDIFNDTTAYDVSLKIDEIQYAGTSLSEISIDASQRNSNSVIGIAANDPNLKLTAGFSTTFSSKGIKNRSEIDVQSINFQGLNLMGGKFESAMKLNFEATTDLKESHTLRFNSDKVRLITKERTFTPANIYIIASTTPNRTYLKTQNGDLSISGEMDCGYMGLAGSLYKIAEMFQDAMKHEEMVHFMHDYEKQLPSLAFNFKCGNRNMLANALAMKGMNINNVNVDINLGPQEGLNARGGVYGFKNGDINLDTIRFITRQEGNQIRYYAGVRSTSVNPDEEKETYSAMLYGNLTSDSLSTNFMFRDSKDGVGVKLGMTTIMRPYGLNISFSPNAVLMNRKFRFSDGNYVKIGKGLSVEADVTLSNEENSGMHIYTEPDEAAKYNIRAKLFNVYLDQASSIIPYAPDIAGLLNLDAQIRTGNGIMALNGNISIDDAKYEGEYIGNEKFDLAYSPDENNIHNFFFGMQHNGSNAMRLSGSYDSSAEGYGLAGKAELTNFPMSIPSAFTKSMGIAFEGDINGDLILSSKKDSIETHGRINLGGMRIHAFDFATSLRMGDTPVKVIDNKITFDKFSIFAHGSNPFSIDGTVDLTRLSNPELNIRMNATNYELINAPKRDNAMFYGKLFLNTNARIRGTLSNLTMRGNVTMLNKSDLTYVMLDAPIESEKELDGLVEFVNFNDTTAVAETEKSLDLGKTNINLNIKIEEGARINADLDKNRNNYVTTEGEGNLNITYSNDAGLKATGKYQLNEGEFKLTLPIIPLKTLDISDGSNLVWSGDVLNPELDITALEHVTTSVTFEDNSMIPVPFDVGVKVTNTLEKMDLGFTIASPENTTVQNQLNALDADAFSRYAVTMLITGAYAGNSKGVTISNALSSFIDAKINDIAGTAMKDVSVNVGINDATNAETGGTYKNYSFSFSKRFWNDRFTVVIGGEVNSGDHPETDNSFINNASLEWKINEGGNRFLKLFYDKNYESILEGEITETGVGYVYQRKLGSLKELFIFRKKEKNAAPLERSSGERKERGANKEEKETK